MDKKSGLSHRDYVIDRAKRIQKLFAVIESDDDIQKRFLEHPEAVAEAHGVSLSSEEIYAIKAIERVDMASLRERLAINPVAFFDANCSCAMIDMGLIASQPARNA